MLARSICFGKEPAVGEGDSTHEGRRSRSGHAADFEGAVAEERPEKMK